MKNKHNVDDVWNEFSSQIRGYLLKKVQQKDDADDLLQEIFIKIHNKLRDLKDEKKLAPWIYQIVRNSLTDYYRKNRLETSEFDEERTESSIDETSDDIYSACVSGCLQVFMNRLPDKYKVPLELSDIKGLKQKDIADQMNLSYSGLKSRVQRGREMIKDMFVDCACISQHKNGIVMDTEYDTKSCQICNPSTN
ncbi:MAG: RNA polymerase sigma factor SigZ [Thermodesulfobacteriota bacterium]|nr:MAG: RNA polymerase sigma factor SigZ [Thermodesulfobacteriota bacterium]